MQALTTSHLVGHQIQAVAAAAAVTVGGPALQLSRGQRLQGRAGEVHGTIWLACHACREARSQPAVGWLRLLTQTAVAAVVAASRLQSCLLMMMLC